MTKKTSDNMASSDFYKIRSYSGCVSAAFDLLCNNFATIFKKTWLYATLLSVICGMYAFVTFPTLPAEEGGVNAMPWLVALAEMAVLTLCATVANSRTKAGFLSLINGATIKKNFSKHLKVSLILLVTSIAVLVLATTVSVSTAQSLFAHKVQPETADNVILGIFTAFGIITLCCYLPFSYSVTKHLLNDSKTKDIFGHNYHTGMKRFGFLFVIGIITALVLTIVCIFMALPAFITTTASRADNFGVENGDPTGLPSYFPWLSFLTNTVVCFVMTYIIFWIDMAICYAYGTIETERTEALQQKETTGTQHD